MTNGGTGQAIVSTAKYFHIAFLYSCAMQDQHNQLTVITRELIALKRGLNCVEFNMDNISEQDAYDYRTGSCEIIGSGLGTRLRVCRNCVHSPVHSIFRSESDRDSSIQVSQATPSAKG